MAFWKNVPKIIFRRKHRTPVQPDDANQIPVPRYASQFAKEPGQQPIQVTIGLDFGTAYTKVVIGERRKAYAVPFGKLAHKDNPYLLPGVLVEGDDGALRLGETGHDRRIADLKMRILDGDRSDTTTVETVAFLALALQEARSWFMNTYWTSYRHNVLDWNINIGLPATHYQDDRLVDFYRSLVKSAWAVSTLAIPLTMEVVAASATDNFGGLPDHAIGVFPEFAAQINGYVRSPMRRSDVHLLMDVGAGTVDIAAFNVHQEDGEDVFPILGSSVPKLGAAVLRRRRLECADGPELAEDIADISDTDICRLLNITENELIQRDKPTRMEVKNQVRGVVRDAKCKYPKSPRWIDGAAFFLCGGGARVGMYRNLTVQMVEDRRPCALDLLQLPIPERLVAPDVDDAEYDRLSVAYGLSFDQFDIGKITPTEDIDDLSSQPASAAESGGICFGCAGSGGARGNNCRRCGGSGWLS